jgi:hypothetical protein
MKGNLLTYLAWKVVGHGTGLLGWCLDIAGHCETNRLELAELYIHLLGSGKGEDGGASRESEENLAHGNHFEGRLEELDSRK